MSSIKAIIFLNILLLITSHTCGNRLHKIKAEISCWITGSSPHSISVSQFGSEGGSLRENMVLFLK